MPRNYNNSNNTLKQIAAFLLVIVLLAVIGVGTWIGVASKGFKDWSEFTGPAESSGEEPVSGVTDGDGNEMTGEEVYVLPTAMVYAAPTAASETASQGITVKATVLPDTAVNKAVMWGIGFAESNEWSNGKEVEDYVTVMPDAGDSSVATIACLQPFGAQIQLIATAAGDPTKSATCTIDYAQTVTEYTLSFGGVDCAWSNITTVPVEMTYLADTLPGGLAEEQITTSEVYTIADELTVTYQLQHATARFLPYQTGDSMGGYMQNWLSFGQAGSVSASMGDYDFDDLDFSALTEYDIQEKGLYFGIKYFAENMGLTLYQQNHPSSGTAIGTKLVDLASGGDYDTTLLRQAYEDIKTESDSFDGLWLFDLVVTIEGSYTHMKRQTSFAMGRMAASTVISGIELDKEEIVFPVSGTDE